MAKKNFCSRFARTSPHSQSRVVQNSFKYAGKIVVVQSPHTVMEMESLLCALANRTIAVIIPHFIVVRDVFLFSVLPAVEITYPNSHTKNVDAQRYIGVVANIHILDAIMHHGI